MLYLIWNENNNTESNKLMPMIYYSKLYLKTQEIYSVSWMVKTKMFQYWSGRRHQPVLKFTMVEWKGWNSYKYISICVMYMYITVHVCIADKFKIKCWYVLHDHFNPYSSDWQMVLPCGWWQLPEYWPAGETPTDLQPHPTLVHRQAQSESPSGDTEQE